MSENFVDARNSFIVKEAKKIMLQFIEEYFADEKNIKAKDVIERCEIYFVHNNFLNSESRDQLSSKKTVGGKAEDGVIYIPKEFESETLDDFSRELALKTVIHEFAHIFSRTNSEYGNMFEEGVADTFARACILNFKMKQISRRDDNMLPPSVFSGSSWEYRKAESQISAIMYVLNQHGLDIKLMEEYLLGDQNVFKQKCTEIFGEGFGEYFELASSNTDEYYNDISKEDSNSEIKLVEILSQYIKNNNMSLKNYVNPSYWMLFEKNSRTMEHAVVKAGVEALREDEKSSFAFFEYGMKIADREEKDNVEEKRNRVKALISEKYNLTGKSKAEIYGIILDLCGGYIQRKDLRSIENTIFIEELSSLIPDLESFVNEMLELNRSSTQLSFLETVNLENISYDNIIGAVHAEYEQVKQKLFVNKIKTKFNNCATKEELLARLEELKTSCDPQVINQALPNFEDFTMFIEELKEEIPESLEQTKEWNYESLYKELSKRYIVKKEVELAQVRKAEKECEKSLQRISVRYNVNENEGTYLQVRNQNEGIQGELQEKRLELQREMLEKGKEQSEKNNLSDRREILNRKNILIRLFYSNELKRLDKQITTLENSIQRRNFNIQQISGTIKGLEAQIRQNEQQIINLSGLTIARFQEVLEECKTQGLTQEKLIENGKKIKEKMNSFAIQEREQELARLYRQQGNEIPSNKRENVEI